MTPPRRALVLAMLLSSAQGEECVGFWCAADRPSCGLHQLAAKQDGDVTYTVPYYSSVGDIEAPSANASEIEFALIISHGAVADPGGYWCAGMEAGENPQNGVTADRVAVIAPWFLDDHSRVSASATQLQWSSSAAQPGGSARGWRGGADSDPAGGRPGDVSSYRVLDILVERLLEQTAFPRLRGVILWGDSAGGQVLSRYAITTHLDAGSLSRMKILSSNPSSFPYPSPLRFQYSFTDDTCQLGALGMPDVAACPDYDSWLYGMGGGGQPPYVVQGLAEGGADRLPSVDVFYLQGSDDTCNEDGTCGTVNCSAGGLDKSCEAMLQGPMRLWRGVQYKAALDAHYGRPVHRLLQMQGVGHDAYAVVRSPDFIAAAFDGWPAATDERLFVLFGIVMLIVFGGGAGFYFSTQANFAISAEAALPQDLSQELQ